MKSDAIKSYKQHKLTDSYDAIIIGSGIGSLACGAILAKQGKRPLLLERHYTAGGYTHVFKRNGYEWDVGIHYIGGVNYDQSTVYRLFDYLSDGQMQWEDMGNVYDRIFFGDETFDFVKGRQAFIAQLKTYFPDEARAIDQYVDLVRQSNKANLKFYAEKALSPMMSRVMGGAMRRDFMRFAQQTTREVLEELTNNEKLIGVLTAQYGDYGLPPSRSSFAMHASVVYHYLYGAAFPVGGSARIAETISDVIGSTGGLILTNAEVAEIIVEKKRAVGVKLVDGRELLAPLVISGAGIFNTYERMLPEDTQKKLKLDELLQKVEPSVAHLGLYLGFKETAAELGLNKTNYWIYPDGAYNHDESIEQFFADPTKEFPLVYVSFPSAKDPTWEERYPGRATVDIITLGPYEWFEKWVGTRWKRRGEEYDAFKEELSQRLLKVLYRYEPQLEGKVDHYELSTPLSTSDFVNYSRGEIYGLNHDPSRFEQKFLRPHTPIQNLYLTGQDITTAGVAAALLSGFVTMSAIDGKDHLSQILR